MHAFAPALLVAAGELTGNWSWTVWLLIPLVVVVALVTALCLGPGGEPTAAERSAGGVSRFLARTETQGSTVSKEASH